MSQHSFDVEVANEVGIEKALILSRFKYLIEHSAAHQQNVHDGKIWCYSTAKALSEIYSYMKRRAITNYLSSLVEDGYLECTAEFNKNRFDQTRWYTFTDQGVLLLKAPFAREGYSIGKNDQCTMAKFANDNKESYNNNSIIGPEKQPEHGEEEKIASELHSIFQAKGSLSKNQLRQVKLRLSPLGSENLLQGARNAMASEWWQGRAPESQYRGKRRRIATFSWFISSDTNVEKMLELDVDKSHEYETQRDRCIKEINHDTENTMELLKSWIATTKDDDELWRRYCRDLNKVENGLTYRTMRDKSDEIRREM